VPEVVRVLLDSADDVAHLHERPGLGRSPDTLRAGDVITLEPGCYRQGYGGVRLEDLVIVTEDGCETLTDFPYSL